MVDNRYDGRLPEPPYECPSCAKWSVTANDQAQTIEALLADKRRLADTVTAQVEEMNALRARVALLEKVAELPAEWHTCGHHPHLGCAACEIRRRAKEGK